MSTFDEREAAFEALYAHDEEMKFKAKARRNKLLGLWASDLMGKSSEDAKTYAAAVVASDFEEAGHEDVFQKISSDLGELTNAATIRDKMNDFLKIAKEQVAGEV